MIQVTHLIPGARLGKYRIVSELGRGGMGIVLLAEDDSLGRRVALKVLSLPVLAGDDLGRWLREEAKAVAALNHPNIVHLHAFDVLDGLPIIEMEYIEGGSLSQRLVSDVVTVQDVVRYTLGVASALAYCHGRQMIHRDVKPSNILIDSFGVARLADFGIAQLVDDAEEYSVSRSWSTGFQGTPRYAPPEAWDGESPTELWDLYSLGAVMFESFTGEPPYRAESPLQLAKEISSGPPPRLRTVNPLVSPALDDLVHSLLSSNPDERPESADAVVRSLKASPEADASLNGDSATVVTPTSRRTRTRLRKRPRGQRRKIPFGAVLPVLVAIAAGLIWLQWNSLGIRSGTDINEPAKPSVFMQSVGSVFAAESLDEFLGQSKGVLGERASIYEVHLETEGAERVEHWLIGEGPGGVPERAITSTETHLGWVTFAVRGANTYTVSGHWAGYEDVSGTIFRHGTLDGILRWRSAESALLGRLTYRADEDGSATEQIVWAMPSLSRRTDTTFLYALEQSEYGQPMLIEELVPRSLDWAQSILSTFPSFRGGYVRGTIGGDGIELDGAFDEPWWSEGGGGAVVRGYPASANAELHLAALPEGLSFGIRFTRADEWLEPRIELALLNSFHVPQSSSETTGIHIEVDTERVRIGAQGASWEEGLVASTVDRDDVSMETLVPYSMLGNAWALPAVGNVWRINGRIRDRRGDPETGTRVRWGFRVFEHVHHGAVVQFGSAASAEP